MKASHLWIIALVAVVGCGCAAHRSGADASSHLLGDGTIGPDGVAGPPDAATQPDAATPPDAAMLPDAATLPDAAPQPDAATGNPLDPNLDVADPGGTPCTTPGSMTECPGIEVCRFYDSVEGRCESCGTCGNLGDFCSASNQCDILFMCYLGQCTNFCQLGTMMCGPVQNCIDVGHPTHGVCLP